MSAEQPHALRCMEIWGGAHGASDAISVPGVDVWIASQPHQGDAEGGDVHYVSMCGAGNIARIALADVSGHGGAVAHVSSRLRNLMRKHINTPDMTRLMRALNEDFTALESAGHFATAILATYFAPTDHLILCNAGAPRPLWRRADRAEWTVLDAGARVDASDAPSNLPLGVIEPTDYEQFAVRLGRGDLILFVTDGVTEARAADGHMLGQQGLLDLVSSLDASRPEALVGALLDALTSRTLDDDRTVMLLHHNAADPPPLSMGERLSAIARMMGLMKT